MDCRLVSPHRNPTGRLSHRLRLSHMAQTSATMVKYALKALIFFLALPAFFLIAIPFADASTHTYTCADLSFRGGDYPSCASDILTFSSGGGSGYVADVADGAGHGHNYPLNVDNAGEWYFSATVTGSGSFEVRVNGLDVDGSNSYFTETVVDLPFDVPSGNPSGSSGILVGTLVGGSSATISNICITDTPGGCGGGSPPAPAPEVASSSVAEKLVIATASSTAALFEASIPVFEALAGLILVFLIILAIVTAVLEAVRRM